MTIPALWAFQQRNVILRYYLAILKNITEWPTVLLKLQLIINNFRVFYEKIPNEVVYGFILNTATDFFEFKNLDFPTNARIKVINTIAMV